MSVERHLHRLQVRIETIAEDESVSGPTGLSLEETLASLTFAGRHRVQKLLEQVQTASTVADEKAAAEHLLRLAQRAWSGSPSRAAEHE
jgi:hypothetical protein